MANPTVQLNIPIVAIDTFSKSLKDAQVGLEGFYRLGKGDVSNLTEQLQAMAKATTMLAQAFTGTGGLIAGVTAFGAAAAAAASVMAGITVAVSSWARSDAGIERLSQQTGIAHGRLKAFRESASAADFAPGLQALEIATGHMRRLKMNNEEERKAIVALIPEHEGALKKLADAEKTTEFIDYLVKLSETLDPKMVAELTKHFFGTEETILLGEVWKLSKEYEKQFEMSEKQLATVMEIEATLNQIMIEWNVLLNNIGKWTAPEVLRALKYVADLLKLVNPQFDPITGKPEDPKLGEERYHRVARDTGYYFSQLLKWSNPMTYGALIAEALAPKLQVPVTQGYLDFIKNFSFISSAGAGTMPGGAFGAGGVGAFGTSGGGALGYGGAVSTYGGGGTGRSGDGGVGTGSTGGHITDAPDPSGIGGALYDPVSATGIGSKVGEPRPGHTHAGDDILIAAGSPMYAVKDGTITSYNLNGARQPNRASEPSASHVIRVDWDDGTWSYYMHGDLDPSLKKGSRVKGGQVIGKTGRANSVDHLHFEMHGPHGELYEPSQYFGWDKKNLPRGGQVARTSKVPAPPHPATQQATDPAKSSSLAPTSDNNTKIVINLNVTGPSGTRAIANMNSKDELFDQDTIRRAVLA
jgi:murein DD-endopeptidase MepM/ murein hydrolase activator NlpD